MSQADLNSLLEDWVNQILVKLEKRDQDVMDIFYGLIKKHKSIPYAEKIKFHMIKRFLLDYDLAIQYEKNYRMFSITFNGLEVIEKGGWKINIQPKSNPVIINRIEGDINAPTQIQLGTNDSSQTIENHD